MIKRVTRNLLLASAALAPTFAAAATVISFDPLPAGVDLQQDYGTISSEGFNFSADPYQFLVASGPTADSDGNYLIWGWGPSVLRVERADKAAFDVISVDLGLNWYSGSAGADVTLDIAYANGGIGSLTLTLDQRFRTFDLGLSGVRSLSFDQTAINAYGALDNLTVAAALPVPEPETYASMLAGLAVLAAVSRRRLARRL